MPVFSAKIELYPSGWEACRDLSKQIAINIIERRNRGKNLVLGLATGSTPIPLYQELVRLHREDGLSFSNVITFNLDEYYGLPADDPESYHEFMRRTLFQHIDLPPDQTHLPDGMTPRSEITQHCADYEKAIEDAGRIDLQILGIGRSGHIGFNEPFSEETSLTRLVSLAPTTRVDAQRSFGGIVNVPTEAITMGVGTILRARRIFLIAWGRRKAEIVARSLKEEPRPELPASLLQHHPNVHYLLEEAAASALH